VICEKCGKEFFEDYRKDRDSVRKNPIPRFCSRGCANTHTPSVETKEKIKNSMRESPAFAAANKKKNSGGEDRNCVVCGELFHISPRSKKGQTCSKECKAALLSYLRSKQLAETGTNWKWERKLFEYEDLSIECDSALEEAGVIYLKDIFKADSVERYKNLINYHEGNLHRTYNPDFWVIKNKQVYLVEVKMKWTSNSTHFYNRTIPIKREALERFCQDKGYTAIWLDFDYAPEFYSIYQKHLKTGRGREHFVKLGCVSPHSDKV
jgi:hypothetical protein